MNQYTPTAHDVASLKRTELIEIRTMALRAAVEVQGQSRPEPSVVVKHAEAYEKFLTAGLPELPDVEQANRT